MAHGVNRSAAAAARAASSRPAANNMPVIPVGRSTPDRLSFCRTNRPSGHDEWFPRIGWGSSAIHRTPISVAADHDLVLGAAVDEIEYARAVGAARSCGIAAML